MPHFFSGPTLADWSALFFPVWKTVKAWWRS